MTGFADRFKLQELRVAVLNDLKEFIPQDHYSSVPVGDEAQRCIADWKLWKLIIESHKQHQISLTKRQSAANDVLIYSALLLANDLIVESQLQPRKEIKPLSDDDMDILKGNIDTLLGHKHNLERAVKAWADLLPELEAKPFVDICKYIK